MRLFDRIDPADAAVARDLFQRAIELTWHFARECASAPLWDGTAWPCERWTFGRLALSRFRLADWPGLVEVTGFAAPCVLQLALVSTRRHGDGLTVIAFQPVAAAFAEDARDAPCIIAAFDRGGWEHELMTLKPPGAHSCMKH